jgi:hypothetical protein
VKSDKASVDQDALEYEQLIDAWGASGFEESQVQANRLVDRSHVLAVRLRRTSEGRARLLALIHRERRGARLLAASDCLAFEQEESVRVLEELEAGDDLHAVSAKYTLKGLRDGSFDVNWE